MCVFIKQRHITVQTETDRGSESVVAAGERETARKTQRLRETETDREKRETETGKTETVTQRQTQRERRTEPQRDRQRDRVRQTKEPTLLQATLSERTPHRKPVFGVSVTGELPEQQQQTKNVSPSAAN